MKDMKFIYKQLTEKEINCCMLENFTRYQETKLVSYKEDNLYTTKKEYFVDDWDNEKKKSVIHSLRECVLSGGKVVGAYHDNKLVGFGNVESKLLGSSFQYIELAYLHVTNEFRHQGIGRQLFELICFHAKRLDARKLYIGAHPSVETQAFYFSLDCQHAEEIIMEIYIKEPLDIQLEKLL
jgi:predicted N-acetyltransferase YhbS